MLDRVRDVDLIAVDARFGKRAIEELPGRADEWPSRAVFLVARLLADHHDPGARLAFAENGLRGGFPQRARLAFGGVASRVVE
jgi:hypothetical protein